MAADSNEIVAATSVIAVANATRFSRFDVATDDSDHHYHKSSKPSDQFTNATSAVHKKIMKEWKLLDKNLPDSIYVRVYEHRIDLFRAAIVGAAGTPYHDALFFFDVAFPPDYPNRPPQVHYRSYGFRLNPNLYTSGRVCLSLLNTWSGKKSEKWDPSRSTVLQVLLSLQALVLNEKPYFNEPGFGGWSGRTYWEKKSSGYNEDVFILCCKTTLCLLRRPPKNFEQFVTGHFHERANAILSACNAYKSGAMRVGEYNKPPQPSSRMSKLEVSRKFKESMELVYAQLVVAFAKNGASVGNFVEQLKVEREAKVISSTGAKLADNTNPAGSGKRFINKLKKIFFMGLKKAKTLKNPGTPGVSSS
ncbi:hypothetical protein Nepgr_031572 [Nepenthes gracilis]|uniref:UBC core domain-containing protein n=1 Tax=Nepenthes gracilis TaxID=150966 RepID=A0AAD3Y777_NEPGR|nr:hypothetical protein Nepgr_031572 [Nepenthes gracilis]